MDKLSQVGHILRVLPEVLPELKDVIKQGLKLRETYLKANEDQKIDFEEGMELLKEAMQLIKEINDVVEKFEQ